MKKEKLIKELKKLQNGDDDMDNDINHARADWLLVEYIGDEDIKREFDKVGKWYG